MKICFFNDIPFLGGGELWVLHACRHLAATGHEVSVVAPHGSALQVECQRRGIDVYVYSRAMDGFPFREGLFHFLRERQVDVLYCTVMGNFCEAEVLEGVVRRVNVGRAGRPMMIILKSGLPPVGDLSARHYGAGAGPPVRRLHVVSERVRAAFAEWVPAMNGDFVEVMLEGTDASRFARDAARRREARSARGIARGDVVVTCLARLAHGMKGQSVLLRAIPRLLERHPRARFVFAGDGPDRALLEELAEDLGVSRAVHFAGHVDDVPSLLAASDVVCHPSLNDGIPNALVEAMTMGLPVVASAVGGIPELVTDGESGLLVMPNDVRSLTGALDTLLGDSRRRRELGTRGHRALGGRFDLARNLDRLAGRLEEELATYARSPRRRTAPPAPPHTEAAHVLFLFNVLRTGGEETELEIVTAHLDRRRFSLSVLSTWKADEQSPVLENLRAWSVPVDDACHTLHDDDDKIAYIVDKIRRERVRIVVAFQDAALAYRVFERLSPDECRLIEHGGIVSDAGRIPKDRTARYVGVSRDIAEAAAPRMPDPSHALFIPSMVDTEVFDGERWAPARAAIRDWLHETVLRPHGYDGESRVVLFVGRLDPKKRVEEFIRAARAVTPEEPRAIFLVVGGHDVFRPEYERAMHEEGRDLVDARRLFFLGPRSDVPGILSASHILILPSVGEGMSHVISEAGAAGLAVIATDDGAAREQLDDGACGCVVAPGDDVALTDALRSLLRDDSLRMRLGGRLRERVRERYAARVVMPAWHDLLAGVLRELERPPAARSSRGARANGTNGVGRAARATRRLIESEPLLPFPTSIQIQTNTHCNATCVMCPHPVVSREVSMGRMDEALYRRILDECAAEPGLRRIEPFLMNEPFTDTRMVDWIAMAKEVVPHAAVTVTTNGSLVTPAVSDRLVRSGLDAIWFSFNGATRETYEHIMGISYDRVRQNIDYLLSIRPPSLQVLVNMIETVPMREEIAVNIREWQRKGVEAGSSPLVNRGGNVENFAQLNYMPLSERPIRVCELPFYRVYVLYTGELVLCCMDWRRQVVLGNLRTSSIRDIWRGEKLQDIRRRQLERRLEGMPLCSTCSYTLK